MLRGKRKLIYAAVATVLVLTGIFTVRNNYFLTSEKGSGLPYVQYIKNAVSAFAGSNNGDGIMDFVFTVN